MTSINLFSGKLEIYYNLSTVSNHTVYNGANITDDIGKQQDMVVMNDKQDTVKISIPIKDDSKPEPDEIFRVRITSVRLVSPSYNQSQQQPRIGKSSSVLILIEANDGAQGELSFAPSSVK